MDVLKKGNKLIISGIVIGVALALYGFIMFFTLGSYEVGFRYAYALFIIVGGFIMYYNINYFVLRISPFKKIDNLLSNIKVKVAIGIFILFVLIIMVSGIMFKTSYKYALLNTDRVNSYTTEVGTTFIKYEGNLIEYDYESSPTLYCEVLDLQETCYGGSGYFISSSEIENTMYNLPEFEEFYKAGRCINEGDSYSCIYTDLSSIAKTEITIKDGYVKHLIVTFKDHSKYEAEFSNYRETDIEMPRY